MAVTTKIQPILTYKAFTNSQNKMQKKEKTKKSVKKLIFKDSIWYWNGKIKRKTEEEPKGKKKIKLIKT